MAKGKRFKEQETKRKNIIIIKLILFLIFGTMFVISGIHIFKYIQDGKENEKIQDELSQYIVIENTENSEDETTEESIQIDFDAINHKNSDTIGFLKVNGTNISTIVVQAENNSYYLGHNFEKNPNKAGWVFADYRNKFDGTDKNIIIYGHNMKDGSMFASLKNILTANWQNEDENTYIDFITENEVAKYKVFSVYQIESEDYYITTDFSDDTSFEKFVNKLKSRSEKDFNVEVNGEDQILTLSTCGNSSKYRVVLHAIKIDF